MKLRQRRQGGWKWWEWVKRQLAWPLQQAIRLVHWRLSKLMLLSLEVAMEYMLALLHSPQVCACAWWPQKCLLGSWRHQCRQAMFVEEPGALER